MKLVQDCTSACFLAFKHSFHRIISFEVKLSKYPPREPLSLPIDARVKLHERARNLRSNNCVTTCDKMLHTSTSWKSNSRPFFFLKMDASFVLGSFRQLQSFPVNVFTCNQAESTLWPVTSLLWKRLWPSTRYLCFVVPSRVTSRERCRNSWQLK